MHSNSSPRLSVETLRTLVERGKTRQPELAGRIEKAASIVLLRAIEELPGDNWAVESESEPGRLYTVAPSGCDCPDGTRAPLGYCKHRIAVWLLRAAEDHERQQRAEKRHQAASDDRVSVAFGLAFARQ